jgi:vacuolar-type H+-ATPase subunit C/Vma6
MAEGERLDALCRLRSVPELVRAVLPQSNYTTAAEFQQAILRQLAEELADYAAQLNGAGSALLSWLRVRLQVENLKVLARALATGRSVAEARPLLVALPGDLSLDLELFAAANSLDAFVAAVPQNVLREGLVAARELYERAPRPLVLEAALDKAYFSELLRRTKALAGEARLHALPLTRQEIDTFHLMLIVRGHFTYRLPADQLVGFHVTGAGISQQRFTQMCGVPDVQQAAHLAVGIALPPAEELRHSGVTSLDASTLEKLGWNRFHQLARRAFRRSHMAVIAYTALRRIEVANLITLSEGIRAEVTPDVLRARLIPSSVEISGV